MVREALQPDDLGWSSEVRRGGRRDFKTQAMTTSPSEAVTLPDRAGDRSRRQWASCGGGVRASTAGSWRPAIGDGSAARATPRMCGGVRWRLHRVRAIGPRGLAGPREGTDRSTLGIRRNFESSDRTVVFSSPCSETVALSVAPTVAACRSAWWLGLERRRFAIIGSSD